MHTNNKQQREDFLADDIASPADKRNRQLLRCHSPVGGDHGIHIRTIGKQGERCCCNRKIISQHLSPLRVSRSRAEQISAQGLFFCIEGIGIFCKAGEALQKCFFRTGAEEEV